MQLKSGKNIRLFQNEILEALTFVPPILPLALWIPIIVALFYYSVSMQGLSYMQALFCSVAGLLVWTPSEYFLHRFIFHFKPHGPLQTRLAFLIHGVHHTDPNDQRRLLMPPVAAILIALVFYGLFFCCLGRVYTNPFFSGFLVGYLLYDYTHFAVHYFNLKSKWFQKVKQNHMRHHFVDDSKLYGVSSPLWDYILRTR